MIAISGFVVVLRWGCIPWDSKRALEEDPLRSGVGERVEAIAIDA